MLDTCLKIFCWRSKLVYLSYLLSKELCRNYWGLLLHMLNMRRDCLVHLTGLVPIPQDKRVSSQMQPRHDLSWTLVYTFFSHPSVGKECWEKVPGRRQLSRIKKKYANGIDCTPFSQHIGSVLDGTGASVDLALLLLFMCRNIKEEKAAPSRSPSQEIFLLRALAPLK